MTHSSSDWKKLSPKLQRLYRRLKYDKQIYLVSYPKCGRTWLCYMLFQSMRLHFGLDLELDLGLWECHQQLGIPFLKRTHDGSEERFVNLKSHLDMAAASKEKYKNEKVIFMVRDPRDVLVSFYFHVTKRVPKLVCPYMHPRVASVKYKGTIHEFIRNDYYGIRKVISFYNAWHRHMQVPRGFLLVKYEDMHKTPKEVLDKSLRFMGFPNIGPEIMEEAIKLSSFENMREKETENARLHKNIRLMPADVNDPESYKVRRGKIGGYVDYLNQEDIAFLNWEINTSLSDFYSYYKSG